MAEGGIPDDVDALIGAHIDSVHQLEALLLVYRVRPAVVPRSAIARELAVGSAYEMLRLRELASAALLDELDGPDGPSYRYRQEDPDLDRAVGHLADAYARFRVATITRIFSKPSEPLRSFADAFRFRRGK